MAGNPLALVHEIKDKALLAGSLKSVVNNRESVGGRCLVKDDRHVVMGGN